MKLLPTKIPRPYLYLALLLCIATWIALFVVLPQPFARLSLPFLSHEPLPEEFKRLETVYRNLQEEYIDPSKLENPEYLIEAAIRGMLKELDDPYTHYLNRDLYHLQTSQIQGFFGGIGARIEKKNGSLILYPMPGSPAKSAGLFNNDILLSIDGIDVKEMSQTEIVVRIRGEINTLVELQIARAGLSSPITVVIERSLISLETVELKKLDNDFILLNISRFSRSTPDELEEAIGTLDINTVNGIIVDLRNNPGGLVESVLTVTGHFLNEKVIFHQVEKDGNQITHENDQDSGLLRTLPLAVIVNNLSASASEIFAGAIQDHKRGMIVGENTFGKGSVGLLFELPGNTGLSITSARWLTPLKRPIEAIGIKPDILVVDDPTTQRDEALDKALKSLNN
jgi:carboxyl-terminal processing protease